MINLYVTIGLSGSGKSTYCNNAKADNCVVISSDTIREEFLGDVNDQSKNSQVFDIFYKRVKDEVAKGTGHIFLDATFLSRKDRKRIKEFKNNQNITVWFLVFAIDVDICIERDKNRNRTVGEKIIRKQMNKFEMPLDYEFDKITILSSIQHYPNLNCFLLHNYDHNINTVKDIILDNTDSDYFRIENPHHKNDNLAGHLINSYNDAINKTDDANIQLACLLHDIGFIFTKTYDDDGVAHYYNHPNVGTYWLMSHFTVPYEVLQLINYHMLPYNKDIDGIKKFGEEFWNKLLIINEIDKLNQ